MLKTLFTFQLIHALCFLYLPIFTAAAAAAMDIPKELIAARESYTWNLHASKINFRISLFDRIESLQIKIDDKKRQKEQISQTIHEFQQIACPSKDQAAIATLEDAAFQTLDNFPENPNGLTEKQLAAHRAATGNKRYVFGKEVTSRLTQKKELESLKSNEERAALLKSLQKEAALDDKEQKELEATYNKKNEELKKATASLTEAEEDLRQLKAIQKTFSFGHGNFYFRCKTNSIKAKHCPSLSCAAHLNAATTT